MWRKIQEEDIKLGTVIRLTKMMNDGAYSMATIVAIHTEGIWKFIKVARPYAYAHKDFSTNQPLLGAEVFPIGISEILRPDSDVEVFQGRDEVRSMAT
jgi:hypothetical protein